MIMKIAAHGEKPSEMAGLPYALITYVIWGIFPLYFKLLQDGHPLEVMAHRVIWSLPVCLIILQFRHQMADFIAVFRDWRALRILIVSGLLIAGNWLTYIYAVFTDHVLAASLGYYLNPLLNVVLATLFLGERLTRLQLLAVSVAALGVAILVAGALDTLWLSLLLAGSFSLYGLLRKIMPVPSLPALAVETSVLMPVALIVAGTFFFTGTGAGFGRDANLTLWLVLSGVVTAVPLLTFATAARLMSYVTLGFVQYVGPTILFMLSLFVFKEPLNSSQLFCFALIWLSVAIFSYDMWARSKKKVAPPIA